MTQQPQYYFVLSIDRPIDNDTERVMLRKITLGVNMYLDSLLPKGHGFDFRSRPAPATPDALVNALDYERLVTLMKGSMIRGGDEKEIRRLLTRWISKLRQQG